MSIRRENKEEEVVLLQRNDGLKDLKKKELN
jgi:hypothetical protein